MSTDNADYGVRLRPARVSDLELLLAWRSNPRIYQHFREQDGPLSWDEHLSWFGSRDPERHDYIIEYHGRRVGTVNIAPDGAVGVLVGEMSLHGVGVATAAIEQICDWFADDRQIYAEVHAENEASINLFSKCGFVEDDRDGDWIHYRYES